MITRQRQQQTIWLEELQKPAITTVTSATTIIIIIIQSSSISRTKVHSANLPFRFAGRKCTRFEWLW